MEEKCCSNCPVLSCSSPDEQSSVKVFILRRILFWTTLHGGKEMKNFQNPNSKKFLRTSLAVLKKVAMILPYLVSNFLNQKISASAVAKV
jgi:hypothetical protein